MVAYKPDALHAVYRMDFADGCSYVGITGRPVEDRIQEHLGLLYLGGWCGNTPRAERLSRGWGTRVILQRHVETGYTWTWTVLAEGLSLRAALKREDEEIAQLEEPLHRRRSGRARLRQLGKMWTESGSGS